MPCRKLKSRGRVRRGSTPSRQAQAQEDAKPADASAEGTDEPILVKSIVIEGLEKAGMTAKTPADIEIELDDRPAGLGLPHRDQGSTDVEP